MKSGENKGFNKKKYLKLIAYLLGFIFLLMIGMFIRYN